MRFGRTHLLGLAGDETPLRAETVHRLHTPLGTGEGGDYGLGWGIAETGHQHAGCAGTFFALLVVRPEHDRVYAFATNAAASDSMAANEDDANLAKRLLASLIERFEEERGEDGMVAWGRNAIAAGGAASPDPVVEAAAP